MSSRWMIGCLIQKRTRLNGRNLEYGELDFALGYMDGYSLDTTALVYRLYSNLGAGIDRK